jgi:hypothetical protein
LLSHDHLPGDRRSQCRRAGRANSTKRTEGVGRSRSVVWCQHSATGSGENASAGASSGAAMNSPSDFRSCAMTSPFGPCLPS